MIDDDALLARRADARLQRTGPQVGDYVVFPDGATQDHPGEREERIAHDWGADLDEPEKHLGLQTAPGGSFYLGDGYASFSGSLNPILPADALLDTGRTEPGRFWFFSGDYARADNGVDAQAPCRVYRYAGPAVRPYFGAADAGGR